MSIKPFKTALMAGVTLLWTSLGASAALISQGVTFTFNAVDSDTLRLTVDNVLNATGNWAPVNFFDAFDIRDVGSFSAATATYVGTGQTSSGALGKQVTGAGIGCNNGGGASACFDWNANLALTNHMVFNIDYIPSGGGLDFSNPHLKVAFLVNDTDTSKTGDLLSLNIASDPLRSVPGPIVGAGIPGLVTTLLGMFGLSFWRRRRQTA
jgi:hypothetical protein